VKGLPIVFRCLDCGCVLMEVVHHKRGDFDSNFESRDPVSEIIGYYGGRCPKCGRLLNRQVQPDDVTVKTLMPPRALCTQPELEKLREAKLRENFSQILEKQATSIE